MELMVPALVANFAAPAPAIEHVAARTVTYTALSPVIEYVALALAVTYTGSAPVTEYVVPALSATFAAPAPVIEHVAPSPAVTDTAPIPVVEYVALVLADAHTTPATVIEYAAPSPCVTCTTPALVTEYVTPTPTDFYAVPARMIEYVAPAPVIEHIGPPAVTFFTPCQKFPPAYTMATVTTDATSDTTSLVNLQFFTTADEVFSSHVIGSPLLLDEFAVPVYNQIRQGRSCPSKESVECVQQHTVEQFIHVPIPHVQEQIVESIQVIPRELFPERIEGQIVDVPVPPIEEEIAEVMSSSDAAAHAAPTPVNEYMASSPIDTRAAPAPVIEFMSSSPSAAHAAPTLVNEYLASSLANICVLPAPVVECMSSSHASAYSAPPLVIEHVATALAVASTTPAPVIDYVTPSLVIECIAPAPAVTSVTTGVNLDITSPDAEIFGHQKAIHHCQGHSNRAISDLRTGKEKLQHSEKIQADLRQRLARASRGSPRERRELQDALDEQEAIIRHHHQDVQTSKESLAWAMREIQEKRELVQQSGDVLATTVRHDGRLVYLKFSRRSDTVTANAEREIVWDVLKGT